MSVRLSSGPIWLGAATLVLSGVVVVSAQSGGTGRGRPIEFSVPRGGEVTTNLQQLTSKPDDLRQLEEGFSKPMQPFTPQGSLDGVVAPPTRPPASATIQSKRVKELLERRKNWVFMTPEDLLAAPTVEEILKAPQLGPDGQQDKELPALERYFQRQAVKRSAADNPLDSGSADLFGQPKQSDSRDELAVQEDTSLPSSLRETAEALSKLFQPGGSDSPFTQGAAHGDFSDTFGLGNNPLTKDQMQQHKKLMDGYNALVDPNWRPPAITGPGAFPAIYPDRAAPAGLPATGLPSVQNPALNHGLEAQADILNPRLGPAELPDLNAKALGLTRPSSALPKIDSTTVPPPAPSFEAPRRVFR
jgi:hypothetical protein